MAIRKDTVQLEVIINGAQAGGTFKDLRSRARELTRELSNLTPGTEEFIKKAAELKKVNDQLAQIRAQTRGVAAGFDDAGKRVNPFTDLLKKGAAAAVGFFAVEKIAKWGKELVSWMFKGTAALEDMQDKINRVFGEATDIVEDFARDNAQSLGLTELKYQDLAAAIGAVLVPMGFTREAAAKMSSEIVNLSGVLSEWTNGTKSAADVNDILTKAILGRTKGLIELGINIKDTDVKTRLAVEGQDKLTGSALAQAKAQATLRLIIEKSKDAQIEFAASAGDVSRSQARLTAFFDQIKEKILQQYLPSIKAATAALANFFSPPVQESDLLQKKFDNFKILIRTLESGNLSQSGRVAIIKQLNEEYGPYLKNIDLEKASTDQLNALLTETNDALVKRIELQRGIEARQKTGNTIADLNAQRDALAKEIESETVRRDKLIEEGRQGLASGVQNRIDFKRKELNAINAEIIQAQLLIENQTANLKKQGFDPDAAAAQKAAAAAEAAAEQQRILDKEAALAAAAAAKEAEEAAERARQARFKKAEESIKIEHELQLSALDKTELSEKEFAARKQIIDLEAEIKTNKAKLDILKLAQSDRLNIIRTNANNEAKIRELNQQISLAGITEFFNKEKELRSQFAIATIEDEKKLSAQLQLIALETQQKIDEATLPSLKGSAFDALKTEILKRQREISQLKTQIEVDALVESLELQKQKTIQASDALDKKLEVSEEDHQKERQRIALIYDKKILEQRLKLFDPDSPEIVALQNQIAEIDRDLNSISFTIPADVANQGGFSTPEDHDDELEFWKKLKATAINSAQETASAIATISSNRLETELRHELDAIDAVEQRKLLAAGDNAVLQKKIHDEADRDRLKAEKEAARQRKKIARSEAIEQGALALIEALPNPFAVAATLVATGIQLAIIDSQTFAKGGYTPKRGRGIPKDHTGQEPVGVVHPNEWVAPRHMVEDPQTGPVISYLERVRTNRRGFAEGGFTSVSTTPSGFSQSVSTTLAFPSERIIELLEALNQKVGAWPTRLKADVVLTELEAKQKELNYIRDQSVN